MMKAQVQKQGLSVQLGRWSQLLVGASLGAVLFGCGAGDASLEDFEGADAEGIEEVAELTDPLIARSNRTLYPKDNNLNITVKLCWGSFPAGDAALFAEGAIWYKAGLEDTWFGWDTKLKLDITDECDSSRKQISITTGDADANPSVPQANFKFTNLDSATCNNSTANWKRCVKMFAARSMGYFLGFGDEESALGSLFTVPCPDGHHEVVRAEGDTTVASTSGSPIMSVCRAFPHGDHLLSTGDVNGLRAVYGGAGSVVAGKRYAFRFTDNEVSQWRGKYLSHTGWVASDKIRPGLNTDPAQTNAFTFSYVSGSSSLGNGETIRIQRSDGRGLCLPGPCTVAGCQTPIWSTSPTHVGCTWTAQVLSGGTTAQDNDPVRLTATFPAQGGPTSANVKNMQVRFVGPLPAPAVGQ